MIFNLTHTKFWVFTCDYAEFRFLLFLGFQYLQDARLYESQEEAVSREEVLGRLDQVELSFSVPAVVIAMFVFSEK